MNALWIIIPLYIINDSMKQVSEGQRLLEKETKKK
jgi:hypothetical protein